MIMFPHDAQFWAFIIFVVFSIVAFWFVKLIIKFFMAFIVGKKLIIFFRKTERKD